MEIVRQFQLNQIAVSKLINISMNQVLSKKNPSGELVYGQLKEPVKISKPPSTAKRSNITDEELNEDDLPYSPIELFKGWLDRAKSSGTEILPDAMSLATCGYPDF